MSVQCRFGLFWSLAHLTSFASHLAGNDPTVNGTFKVVGNTGAIAAHAVPFANDLVLFLIRPNSRIAFGGDTSSLPDQAYLLVGAQLAFEHVGIPACHDGEHG